MPVDELQKADQQITEYTEEYQKTSSTFNLSWLLLNGKISNLALAEDKKVHVYDIINFV